jgi:hypothetical protein
MKVIVPAVSFAVLTLFVSSSSALSQDMVAEQVAASSSSQTTQQGEPMKLAKRDDLPDAPSFLEARNITPQKEESKARPFIPQMGPMGPVPPLMNKTRLTLSDKFTIYTHQTFGPPALVFPALGAGIRMANPPNHYPHDWTDGGGAFGRLYGNAIATQTSKRTAEFLTEVVLHEDPRYLPAPAGSNVGTRIFHAISYTFVGRADSGARTIAFSNFAGAAAGGFVGMGYLPDGFNDATHAGQRAISEFMTIGISNIAGEFAPQLAPIIRKLHIPNIVPAWWVPQKSYHP